ncbi:heavy metal translocating P-type ATPase [Suttonella sp. R2A3]|uniref:heavy metal translocating P-type ATPase n=1 Tax=Suttonella sp. R2A3 TaxID=2908648 RepID=UPI001F33041A|nr:heavy metal translocating P-type ATPase [Suttonella sp. R2A3]UJF25161.1 heavy metal translocating P-type ATPase [Suttonella sp. R2A3]
MSHQDYESISDQRVNEHTHEHDHGHDHEYGNNHSCGVASAATPAGELPKQKTLDDGVQTAIGIKQMDCPTEEQLIRKKLGTMVGVKSLEFNLMQRVLTVVHDENALQNILSAIRSLGFEPECFGEGSGISAHESPAKPWWPLALAGVAAAASEAVHWMGMPSWLAAGLALLAIALCGLETYKKGWISLRSGSLNINALMSIAVTGAMIIGQWPEAAMVMTLFSLAELIEAKSLDRARNAIAGLMALTPDEATVRQQDGSWLEVRAEEVKEGSIVRIRPGERIALDGEITEGRSTLNQAPITGESLPVDKTVGDSVFAGTINEEGSFEYRVTAAASNTTLARIIQAVEDAQGSKAPIQRFVDQFARVYTPVVLVIAVLVGFVPPLFDGAWMEWVYKALVLLVIACPCALVISTPVTLVSGLTAAARRGILIKGGIYLEQGRSLRWLALDKTGTITHGKPVQTDSVSLSERTDGPNLAASLASRSDHPVSQAIARAAEENSVETQEVRDFSALSGRGVEGTIDGVRYMLGNHRLIHERGLCDAALETQLEGLERQGKTVVLLANESEVLLLLAVADTVKDSSREAIADLHQLGVKTMMISGDNPHTVAAIAEQVAIDSAHGDQLPQDKLNKIEELAASGTVGMVGDGINDAPALARADIGFAMGAMGTDTAIETADVALMDDNLGKIPEFVQLSQKAYAVLWQNIILALGIKAVFLILTLMGLGTMWMAVFADVGASLLVIANGLRLLKR